MARGRVSPVGAVCQWNQGVRYIHVFNILLLDILTPWWNGGQKRVKRKKAQSWNRKRRKSVRAKMTD